MSDQLWYVYQQEQQLGPFALPQVLQLLDSHMISQDAYLFKAGWKDWRPLEECLEELGRKQSAAKPPADRRQGMPRATIRGRIIVHNNGQLVIGAGVNISAGGIFIETPEPLFKVGETLKLTCRVDGFLKAFNVSAKVVRYNEDKNFPVGYGLQFESLDAQIAKEIQNLIDQENQVLGINKAAQ